MCKVGIVGCSASCECVGGRACLVKGCGRIGGEDVGREKQCMRRGRKCSWEGEQWILAQEKGESKE
jgi:hypothetical protein